MHGFVNVVPCVSRPLPNKTKLKFDQEFKAHWSFCSDLKVLIESKYSIPWVRCAFGNVFCLNFGGYISMIVLQSFNAACLVDVVLFVNWIWYVSKEQFGQFGQIHYCSIRIKSGVVCFVDVFGGEWIAAQLVISQLWSPSHRRFYTCGSDGLAKQ